MYFAIYYIGATIENRKKREREREKSKISFVA